MKENEARVLAAKIKSEVGQGHQGCNPIIKSTCTRGRLVLKRESMAKGSSLYIKMIRLCLLTTGVGAQRRWQMREGRRLGEHQQLQD